MALLKLIAFDADDTLWHNEMLYAEAQHKLENLLAGYASADTVRQHLYATEMRNLALYGYGIKGFCLSMIETAIMVSDGTIRSNAILNVIDAAKEMLVADVELIDGAAETLTELAGRYPLMLITKGDLRDQRAKVEHSGLGRCFAYIEIVPEKTESTYRELLARYEIPPSQFLMIGNSLKSDVLPVVAAGGHAVHIRYQLTWAHEEVAQHEVDRTSYHVVEEIRRLPDLVRRLHEAQQKDIDPCPGGEP
jgi:putative hydrolase of the HAD superfamily